MAPTIPHVSMTASGSLPGGESWSCGLRSLAWATDLGESAGVALAVAVGNRWRALANAADAYKLFGNCTTSAGQALIDRVVVRRLDEDGITVEQYEAAPTTALVAGGTGPTAMPNQCTVVATLITARAGRTGKGRIYLPCASSLTLAANRIPSGTVTALATQIKTMLDGINTNLKTATDSANWLAVQSSVASQEPGAWTVGAPSGYMGAKIVSVRIGDVIDTQRRRRASVREVYSTAVLA